MAWTTTSWDGADWTSVACITDFQSAVNERDKAMGNSPSQTLKIAGDDVQLASFWNSMQSWVETFYQCFIVSHDVGVKRASDYYDGQATIYRYESLAEVFSAAGLSTATWRRYTTHPDDGGSNVGGKMQAGDYIGPWIFDDLQKILNVLIWTWLPNANIVSYWPPGEVIGYVTWAGIDPDWTTAKQKALDYYALLVAGDPAGGSTSTSNASTGESTAYLNYRTYVNATYNGTSYLVQIRRYRTYARAKYVPNPAGISRAADYYTMATKDVGSYVTEEFDTFDNNVSEGVYKLFSSADPAADSATLESPNPIFASMTCPVSGTADSGWCQQPALGQNSSKGNQIAYDTVSFFNNFAQLVILRWDISGGFVYV